VSPAAQVDRLRDGLDPLLRRRYDNADVRLRDLDALGRLASGYESRARMVAELTLDPPASTGDLAGPPLLDDDYLILSTVHSAKGGEWRVVHLIHAADGMFPSDMATGDRGGAAVVLRSDNPRS
jgi:DNA helicase-2/ATP-dependent DNA helicase PcrA